MNKNRDTSGEVFVVRYFYVFYVTNVYKYKLLRLRLHWLYSCLFLILFRYYDTFSFSTFFSDIVKLVLSDIKSFRWSHARCLKKIKAVIAALPPMAKIFSNGWFREEPWPTALFEDLEDGDEMKQMLQIKTRVDGRIEELISASTHDYVGVSIEVQCDLGAESLRSFPSTRQWFELKSGQVSSPSRKSRSTPKSTINVVSFKGDVEVEKVESTTVRDARLSDTSRTSRPDRHKSHQALQQQRQRQLHQQQRRRQPQQTAATKTAAAAAAASKGAAG